MYQEVNVSATSFRTVGVFENSSVPHSLTVYISGKYKFEGWPSCFYLTFGD